VGGGAGIVDPNASEVGIVDPNASEVGGGAGESVVGDTEDGGVVAIASDVPSVSPRLVLAALELDLHK
jgi:hypothetical protein